MKRNKQVALSLPVCERFRPFCVGGDPFKSSPAGTSDDDCMEAELGPVSEQKQHGTLTSAKCFPAYFAIWSPSLFVLAVSEAKMKLNLRQIRFRFVLFFSPGAFAFTRGHA